ncbi:MAG: hypothetical protein OXR73_11590 [Myxococcales bacterium]|nr:hypothetical protein [Myxococcales bacterium]
MRASLAAMPRTRTCFVAAAVLMLGFGMPGTTLAQPYDPSQPYLQPAPAQPPTPAPPTGPGGAAPSGPRNTSRQPEVGQREGSAPPPPAQQPPGPAPGPTAPGPPVPGSAPPTAAAPGYPPAYGYDPYAPPPRPLPEQEPEGGSGFELPAFSVRLDPLDLVLEGRFGLELEVDLLGFMSVELIPMFFITESPVALNLSSFLGRDSEITQHSNGLGGLVGASLGVGFWLSGEPFQGYVLRALITNYGVLYRSTTPEGALVDSVTLTERRFKLLVGSVNRFSVFTLATAFGLGYELSEQERCDVAEDSDGPGVIARGSGCNDVEILVNDLGSRASLVGFLHPWSLEFRLSLGVSFD